MKSQIIKVRTKDIRKGVEARNQLVKEWFNKYPDRPEDVDSTYCCAVAKAIQSQTNYPHAGVCSDGIRSTSYHAARIAHLPRSVSRAMKKFDKGEKIKPFNFRLVWND